MLSLFHEILTGITTGALVAVAFVSFGATVPTSLVLGGSVAVLCSLAAHAAFEE